jgi:predicted RNA-binding protein (virulence factor B family)
MIELGNYNSLEILRKTSVGYYLADKEGTEVLLPTKYTEASSNVGDMLSVFCYLDHMERPVATNLRPLVIRNSFGALEVAAITEVGAFLDWGLEKQLFLPFREQIRPLEIGEKILVYCYLDPKSFRLLASMRLKSYLKTPPETFNPGDKVRILVSRRTNLGWEVIVNQQYSGLVFHSDIFEEVFPGDEMDAYVHQQRPDGKLDIKLRQTGFSGLQVQAEQIKELLLKADGFLPVHDKSSSQEIQALLGMSKKSFKRAAGILYKNRLIEFVDGGIRLINS